VTEVVLVHGAWHGASCWDRVVDELAGRGVDAVAVELPLTGFDDDVRTARTAIEACGPGVVVVGHSYGGFVITEAAAGLPQVGALVYIAAFMTDIGEDSTAIMADYGGTIGEAIVVKEDGVWVDPDRAHDLFYGDSDADTARTLIDQLRPMGLGGAMAQTSEPAWKSVRSTYVLCTNDRALPPAAQRWMAARADTVVELPTDHSPFVTRPGELADVVVGHLGGGR